MTKSWISSNLTEIGIVTGVVGLGLMMVGAMLDAAILEAGKHVMRTGAALFSLFALIVLIEVIRGRKHGGKEEQK